MPAATLEREDYALAALEQQYKVEAVDGTQGVVRNYPIFRAGTFKDSLGRQRTWTRENLDDMVKNFKRLKDSGALETVPVRADHSMSVNSVVGWVLSIKRQGDQLLADFQFTEADAAQKFSSGTFRNRSAEVGAYETNAEEMYWPVLMGFAFVDLAAVEGLHRAQFSLASAPSTREITVPDAPVTPPAATDAPAEPTAPTGVTINLHGAPVAGGAVVPPNTPTAPTAPAAPEGGTAKFRVNGAEVSDFAAVQTHIDTLETFVRESVNAGRTAFVKGLSDGNKIAATQVESLTAHALSLNAEQFDAFKKAYDEAPASALFAAHGGQVTPPNGGGAPAPLGQGADQPLDDVAKAEAIVAMHRRAGRSDDEIKATASGKLLVANGKL
jgi:hypothetical protein